MAVSLSLQTRVVGGRHAVLRIDALQRRLLETKPILEGPVLDVLLQHERAQWSSKAGWAPDVRPTGQLMVRSGTLQAALTEKGAPGQKLKVTATGIHFGLDPQGAAAYGRFHQRGTTRMVARQVVTPLEAGEAAKITVALRRYIAGGPG